MSVSLGASSLLSARSQALLSKLVDVSTVPASLYNTWKYLLLCFDVPRPSSAEDALRNRLIDVAKAMQLDYAVDGAGNLRIRKPATPGYEDRVRVCIQGHLDMVCSKTSESDHDFHKDAIKAYLTEDGAWVKAEHTTLGSDNGVGVAVALAMLEDATLKHGPLEALFTVEEETTMGGALNLQQAPFLQAQALLNADSEEENSVCVGCAGGAERLTYLPVQRQASYGKALSVKISGLCGGHTGCDIHTDRGNAVKFANQVAREVLSKVPSSSIAGFNGGNAPNAIPRDATLVFAVEAAEEQLLRDAVRDALDGLLDAYAFQEVKAKTGNSDGLSLGAAKSQLAIKAEFSDVKGPVQPLTKTASDRLVALVNAIPHGVIRYSPTVAGAVETSNALSVVSLPVTAQHPEVTTRSDLVCDEAGPAVDNALVHCFYRSFSDAQLRLVGQRLQDIANLSGAYISEEIGYFNGWEPITSSPLFTATIDAYTSSFPTLGKPHVYSVHAGLECGPIKKQYPNIHAVSIGPTILGAHSPDEKLEVRTMAPFVQWTRQILALLANTKAADFDNE